MRDYLVFRLYGPLAAWGDIPGCEYRPSYAHPSKSAIIGLLAAALGIRRDEDERQHRLSEACHFAVRVDSAGRLLRDYHTTQVPPRKRGIKHRTRLSELAGDGLYTILSTRDYYCDAAYTVVLRLRDDAECTIEQLANALLKPAFVLYLGRKSCPLALPLRPSIIEATTLKDALDKAPSHAEELAELSQPGEYADIFWEDGEDSGYEAKHAIYRRDVPGSRNPRRWQFTNRREHYASVRKGG